MSLPFEDGAFPQSPEQANQYDAADEDYVQYWEGRDYEHGAETIALKRLLGDISCAHAADVGGGFGRLSLLLEQYAEKVTLLDPSQKQLDAASHHLQGHPRIHPRLMRVGELGLPDSDVDLLTMIRVMHHLPDPEPTLKEVSRVLRPGGTAIIEVANLAHAVNKVRYLTKGQRLPHNSVDIRSASKREEGSIPFVNHHPATVVEQFAAVGLRVDRKLSVSNLRSPSLKRALPTRALLAVERTLQASLASLDFGPSLFFLLRKSA
ncbi:class I SAM-dependent methyltransferase [Streptomyces sp. NPDC051976]|uniref:class I SAM-dependent methyltransferase n=1 Tax=Streptomyces sp. NPDC051976 TaxID=3154947 RepID=UPI003412964B